MIFAVVLGSISLISLTAKAQIHTGCGCDSIHMFLLNYKPVGDPCSDPTVGNCGSCNCFYLNIVNQSDCVINSIDINDTQGACTNFCAFNKSTDTEWICNPTTPTKCDSTIPVGISPALGQPAFWPASLQPNNSELIINVCTSTPGRLYEITFHFADGTTCTETISV